MPLIAKWAAEMQIAMPTLGIRRMKTRWGTCNTSARRIWLNLELIKKPPACMDYVVVHELLHLLERKHSERFVALLEKALPNWKTLRDELNTAPLAHEEWNA